MDIRSLMGGNAYEHYCHPDANMVDGVIVPDSTFRIECTRLQQVQLDEERQQDEG